MLMSLKEVMHLMQERTEKWLQHYLPAATMPSTELQQAMVYGIFNGGKRVRPLLVYATGCALNANLENLDAAACAVEMIHSYSLIHDDLPAMDNADLRRGKPACHKAHGEAIAILAGDALQAYVFQILATHPAPLVAEKRLAMIAALSEASGPTGMAGGQALDITIMDKSITPTQLAQLYHLKTGALLQASVKLGLLGAESQTEEVQWALETYATQLGFAFQLQDDLLDIEAHTDDLGKPQGIDSTNNKTTYPLLLGIEQTRAQIDECYAHAMRALGPLGAAGQLLEELALYLLQRKK